MPITCKTTITATSIITILSKFTEMFSAESFVLSLSKDSLLLIRFVPNFSPKHSATVTTITMPQIISFGTVI